MVRYLFKTLLSGCIWNPKANCDHWIAKYTSSIGIEFSHSWENVEFFLVLSDTILKSLTLFHSQGKNLADVLLIWLQMLIFKCWHWECLPIADMPILKKVPICRYCRCRYKYRHTLRIWHPDYNTMTNVYCSKWKGIVLYCLCETSCLLSTVHFVYNH